MQMDSQDGKVEYAAFIGLDWGSEKHAFALQCAGSNEIEPGEIKQKPEEFHAWCLKLQDKFGGRPVALAIEQSKGAVIYALLSYSFVHIFRINPLSLASYRKAFSVSGAKDDPADAELLLDWVRLHRERIKPWVPDNPETRALQRLVEFRRQVVDQRVEFTNRLTQVLKEYFPQALDWAGDIDSVMACDFLTKWPTLEKAKKVRPDTMRTFYRRHNCRRAEVIEERLKTICTACALTADSAVIETSVIVVQTIVGTLRPLLESIDRINEEIRKRFDAHPDREIFDSFPGAGEVLAPRLLTAMGSDRNRYESAPEVQMYSGTAPVTDRSGKHKWIHRRFACPKFLKQSFHEFAGQSIKFSEWARAYYEMQRGRGLTHHAAVRALAYKWIRIIFRCWKDRVTYDETIYMESLRRKKARLLEYLDAAA
jgi:transposase